MAVFLPRQNPIIIPLPNAAGDAAEETPRRKDVCRSIYHSPHFRRLIHQLCRFLKFTL